MALRDSPSWTQATSLAPLSTQWRQPPQREGDAQLLARLSGGGGTTLAVDE